MNGLSVRLDKNIALLVFFSFLLIACSVGDESQGFIQKGSFSEVSWEWEDQGPGRDVRLLPIPSGAAVAWNGGVTVL